MESVFQNKYKIASNRLRGWNYASDGHYFITIVTANREKLRQQQNPRKGTSKKVVIFGHVLL